MSQKINEALAKLDPSNDAHWTTDGLPRLDVLKAFADDASITRDAVTLAKPAFTRATASAPAATAAAVPYVAPSYTPPAVQHLPVVAETAPLTLQDKLAGAQRALTACRQELDKAQVNYARQSAEVDRLILEVQKATPASAPQDTISGFLAQQVKLLQERGERMAALKGVDLASILPKTLPIDKVRPRKGSFGSNFSGS